MAQQSHRERMQAIRAEEAAEVARQGSQPAGGGKLSPYERRILGMTDESTTRDPTWMGKTADFLTEGAGFWPYMGALAAKGAGINPAPDAPSRFKIGTTLKKHVPTLTKNLLKRNPYSGVGLALLPGALNLGESGYQKFFGDDPDEAGERFGQAWRTARDEGLALGGIGLARRGVSAIRNLSRGLRETIPSVTGAGARAAEAAEEAARAAPAPPPVDLAEEAKTATHAAAAAEDQARTAQDRLRANRRATVLKDATREGGTVGRGGTRRPDFSTKQTHTPGDVEQQGGLPFDSTTYQPNQQTRIWGANTKEVRHVRGLGEIVPIHAKKLGGGTGEFLYRKADGNLQFPPIQRISDPKSPKELVQRLEQILNVDGIRDVNLVASALQQDTLDPTTFEFVRKRLPPELAHALTGGGQDPWKALKRLLGEEVFPATRRDID